MRKMRRIRRMRRMRRMRKMRKHTKLAGWLADWPKRGQAGSEQKMMDL